MILTFQRITKFSYKHHQTGLKNLKPFSQKLLQPKSHSSQIHQIHTKSKILKSLKYSPFDCLIDNRKIQKCWLHSPSASDFMAILRIFPAEFEDKI